MRTKLITEPVFETYVRLIYDCSIDDLCRYVKKKFDYDTPGGETIWGKLVILDEQDEVLLWAKDENMFETVHETAHLVFYWMRFKEIPIEKSTEEVFTHLQSFYLDKISRTFKKKKK